jgi:hypothetical protein
MAKMQSPIHDNDAPHWTENCNKMPKKTPSWGVVLNSLFLQSSVSA